MTGKLFIFGIGYAGLAIARLARAEGWQVSGTVRDPDKAAALAREGIAVAPPGPPDAPPSPAFAEASHVLSTVPPASGDDPAARQCLGWLRPGGERPRWLGYLSTTGVYGDSGGAWIDERTQPQPGPARSRHRLAAEQAWQSLAGLYGAPLHIFRLPAIYGPGRNALEQVLAGTARRIAKPEQVFCRIHVEDAARTVLAAMGRPAPPPGALYNVVDDRPASQADVVAYACLLLGRWPMPLIAYDAAIAAMSEMQRSFYAETRRVRNDRIKRELGIELSYPTYRHGLRALARDMPPSGLLAHALAALIRLDRR